MAQDTGYLNGIRYMYILVLFLRRDPTCTFGIAPNCSSLTSRAAP